MQVVVQLLWQVVVGGRLTSEGVPRGVFVGGRLGRPHQLVYLNCELEPGIWVSVRWSARCHSSKCSCNLAIKSLVKLNHNGFWVSVPRVIDEVTELVKVVVDCLLVLEVGYRF